MKKPVVMVSAILLTVVSLPAFSANCISSDGAAAIPVCKAEIRRYPDNPGLRIRYAEVLMSQKHYDAAVNVLQKAVKAEPHNNILKQKLRVTERYVQAYKATQKNNEIAAPRAASAAQQCIDLSGSAALKACDQVLAKDPKNVNALSKKADILFNKQDYRKALSLYNQALKIDSKNRAVKRKLINTERKIVKQIAARRNKAMTDVSANTSQADSATIASEPSLMNPSQTQRPFNNAPLLNGSTY